MKFLDTETVVEIYDELVKYFATTQDPISPSGLRDRALLDSAVTGAAVVLRGQIDTRTVFDRAATLLFGVVQNHPFHNGNKRTALVAALAFLKENKHYVECSDDEIFDLVVATASPASVLFGEARGEEKLRLMTGWFRSHAKPGSFSPGPMRTSDFLQLVASAGGVYRKAKKGGSWVISGKAGKGRIRLGGDTAKLDGPVVGNYLKRLGLSYSRTGLLIEEIEANDRRDQALIRDFREVLHRLAQA